MEKPDILDTYRCNPFLVSGKDCLPFDILEAACKSNPLAYPFIDFKLRIKFPELADYVVPLVGVLALSVPYEHIKWSHLLKLVESPAGCKKLYYQIYEDKSFKELCLKLLHANEPRLADLFTIHDLSPELIYTVFQSIDILSGLKAQDS